MIFIDPNLPPEQRKAQLIKLVEMLSSLTNHPAYKTVDAYYAAEEAAAYQSLMNADRGDIAMKASGAYVAIKQMREMPKSHLREAIQQLKMYDDK